MNFKLGAFAFFAVNLLVFSACGDDKSSSANSLPDEVADKAELKTYECNMSVIGEKVFVTDLGKNYECDGEEWFESYDQPKSSANGKYSSSNNIINHSSSSRGSSSSIKFQFSSSGNSSSSFENLIEEEDPDWIDGKYFLPAGTFDCSEFKCGDNSDSKIKKYGEFMDGKDGNVYRVTRAAGHFWFAENLRASDSLYAHEKNVYYDWCELMNLDTAKCGIKFMSEVSDKKHQGLCPNGWHIPSVAEIKELYNYYAKDETKRNMFFALFAKGSFATSTEYDAEHLWYISASSTDKSLDSLLGRKFYKKTSRLPTRCVKDDDEVLKGELECNEKNGGVVSVDNKGNIVQCRNNKWVNNPYRYFKDSRDGKVYHKVKIGNQWWMKENLNYETKNSFCVDCSVMGRIYPWSDVMDSAGVFSVNAIECGEHKYSSEDSLCRPTYPVRGICPEGWHVSSKEEFDILIETVGDSLTAGMMLKDSSSKYWRSDGVPGIDAYGFSARAAASYIMDLTNPWVRDRSSAVYWTSSPSKNGRKAYYYIMASGRSYINAQAAYSRHSKFSVRCVMD